MMTAAIVGLITLGLTASAILIYVAYTRRDMSDTAPDQCEHQFPSTEKGIKADAVCSLCGTPVSDGYLLEGMDQL